MEFLLFSLNFNFFKKNFKIANDCQYTTFNINYKKTIRVNVKMIANMLNTSLTKKKIIFMGSPDFALPCFKKLIEDHNVVACFSRWDRPKNRGQKITATPVKILAEKNDIPVFTPKTLKDLDIIEKIKSFQADFIVVVAYGMILPQKILEATKYCALNLHPSSLPRFRGAAPLQRTLMAGDKETEICIMKMSARLDEGDVFLRKKINIPQNMNFLELHNQTAEMGGDLMLELINNYKNSKAIPQSKTRINYANKITKKEAEIDFSSSGEKILNLIRGLNPFPCSFFYFKEKRIKIFVAKFIEKEHQKECGEIKLENFSIYCSNGLIQPMVLQKEGKKRMSIEEFLKGCESINLSV